MKNYRQPVRQREQLIWRGHPRRLLRGKRGQQNQRGHSQCGTETKSLRRHAVQSTSTHPPRLRYSLPVTGTLLALVVMVGAAAAQISVRPNFAGEWVLDPARTTVTGAPARVSGPARVGSTDRIEPPVKVTDVRPQYPASAQRARISGMVVIEATVDTKGNVREAEVIRSVPELDRAAMEAVAQWRFTPALQNGTPVPTIMTVTVTFAISGVPPVTSNDLRALSRGRGAGGGTGGGAGLGPVPQTLFITQDRDQIRIERPVFDKTETVRYRLDGKVSENRVRLGAAAIEVDQAFESRWEGQVLVTEMTWDAATGRHSRTEAIFLDRATLIVELRRPSLEPGGPPTVRTVVYTRR